MPTKYVGNYRRKTMRFVISRAKRATLINVKMRTMGTMNFNRQRVDKSETLIKKEI